MTDPDTDSDQLKPVLEPEHLSETRSGFKGDFYSRAVFGLSAIIVVTTFVASIIGFAGYAENDQNPGHLLSVLILCLGVGSLAFIPAAIIGYYARTAIWHPMKSARVWIVLALVLPWFPFGFYLIALDGQWRLYGGFAVFTALFFLFWAVRYWRK